MALPPHGQIGHRPEQGRVAIFVKIIAVRSGAVAVVQNCIRALPGHYFEVPVVGFLFHFYVVGALLARAFEAPDQMPNLGVDHAKVGRAGNRIGP